MKQNVLTILTCLLLSLSAIGQKDSCVLYAPNTISMNCHTGEDYQFAIQSSCPISSCTLTIYNRWGEVAFTYEGKEPYWDASKAQELFYVYTITGLYFGGVGFEKQGNFTILK